MRLAIFALLFGVVSFAVFQLGRSTQQRATVPAPPAGYRCTLLVSLNQKERYCLNPVDEKTGAAIPFTEHDANVIACLVSIDSLSAALCKRADILPPEPLHLQF